MSRWRCRGNHGSRDDAFPICQEERGLEMVFLFLRMQPSFYAG